MKPIPRHIRSLRLPHVPMRVALLLLTLCAVVPVANGQGADAYVRWSAEAVEADAEPGINLQLSLRADITDGWKMYAMDSPRPSRGVDITVTDAPADVKVVGSVRQADPRQAFDPNFQIDVTYFVGTADFVFDLDVGPEVDRSSAMLGVDVLFQICNDALGICLPPTTRPLRIRLDGSLVPSEDCLAENGEATATEDCEVGDLSLGFAAGIDDLELPRNGDSGTVSPSYSDSLVESRAGGFFAFLLLAIGAGLAALLTPCVFPMIPLTISYFTRHSKRRSEAVRMATTYGVAIVATFTGLGVLMSLLVGAAGAQSIAASPWVNLFIATVLVLFALSLLGLFELRLPTGVVNFFNRQGTSRSGYLGVLFMGFTLTLVSFSCTAPFVGGLLAATVGGEWFYPIVGMLAFSAAFAFPFVFLALFPKALDALPRSGSWMNVFKVTLGFIELAAAIKFLSNVDLVWGWDIISRPLAIAATIVIFGVAGLYLLGKLSLGHEERPASIGVGRLVSAVAFMALALYMLPGLFGAPLNAIDAFLPPRQVTDMSLYSAFPESMASHDDLWITDDIDGAMNAAAAAGKPLLIDFTGYTCTNCRQMEANVFTRAEVTERFERDYVLSRLYTDGLDHGERFQRYQLGLTGTVALPTYAVVNPVGRLLVAKKSGVMSLDDFVAFLDRGSRDYVENHLATR